MDYEKAYNKVLDRAREIKSKILSSHLSNESCKAVSEYIDTIFPELAESEDKKTLKEIKDFILYKAGHLLDEATEHRFVKYLEKQKEPKKPNIELIQKSWYMEGYHDREFGKEPKWIIKTGEGRPRYEKNPRYGKQLPKEQKPAENIPLSREEMLGQLLQNGSITMFDYLYLIDKREPTGWSEEDETAFGDLMLCIEQAKKSVKDENDMGNIWFAENWLKNRLKSLRPQPHWKPSEDEERLINTSISFLKDFADKGYENAVECIDWLKSKLNGNTCK